MQENSFRYATRGKKNCFITLISASKSCKIIDDIIVTYFPSCLNDNKLNIVIIVYSTIIFGSYSVMCSKLKLNVPGSNDLF